MSTSCLAVGVAIVACDLVGLIPSTRREESADSPSASSSPSPSASPSPTSAASLSISDGPTYAYGSVTVGASSSKSFTITNSGGATASSLSGALTTPDFTFTGGTYPGTGGTCSSTLAAGAACNIAVQFAPLTNVAKSDTLTVTYNNSVATTTATRAVTGTGLSVASLSISDAGYNYGTVTMGSTGDKEFTLTNSGESAATSMSANAFGSAHYTFKGGSYPGTGGTCGATLAASATCTVVVRFAPASSGSKNDTISIAYTNGATTTSVTRAVTGTGQAAAVIVITDASTNDFGSVTVGASAVSRTFTLTNSGEQNATLIVGTFGTAEYTFPGAGFPGTGGTCSVTLNAGLACTVVIQFSPGSSGIKADTLTVAYNNGVGATSTTRELTGIGLTVASLSISDGATYNFGSVGIFNSVDHAFTLTNGGGSTATSMSGSAFATGDYTFAGLANPYPGGGTCGTTLTAGSTCTVIVRFGPLTTGAKGDTLTVAYNNGVSSTTASRALTGIGAVLSSSGNLDTSFNTTGMVAATLSSSNNYAYAIASYTMDNRLVVGGGESTPSKLILSRFLSEGVLDSAFNTSGKVNSTANIGVAHDIVIQPDSKLLVAAAKFPADGPEGYLYRFLTSGNLDTTFHTDGLAISSHVSDAFNGFSVALQLDGRAVTQTQITGGYCQVNRVLTDGALDTSFHTDGKMVWGVSATSNGNGKIKASPDGKLVAVSSANSSTEFAQVARILSTGNLDTTFLTDGLVEINQGGSHNRSYSIGLDSAGYLLFGTLAGSDAQVVKILSDGNLDTTFSNDGFAVSGGGGSAFYDGLVHLTKATGIRNTSGGFSEFVRFNSDGNLDSSFGTLGVAHPPFANNGTVRAVTRRSIDGTLCFAAYASSVPPETQIACVTP